jgi:hypothetical protein
LVLVPNTLSLEDIYITRRGYTIHHILVSVSVQVYTNYRGFAFRKPDPPFHPVLGVPETGTPFPVAPSLKTGNSPA